MRELNVNEMEEVNGGNPWAWMALGYIGGKIIDSFEVSNGWAEGKTLTRRGYR